QCRAVKAMLAVDKPKARELFGEILKLQFPALTCENTLVYEVSDFYDLLLGVAQQTFKPEQLHRDEHIQFVESYVGSITSSFQVAPAAHAIVALKISPSQLE